MKIEIPDKDLNVFLECVQYGVCVCCGKYENLQIEEGYNESDRGEKVVLDAWKNRIMAGLELLVQYPEKGYYEHCYSAKMPSEAKELIRKTWDEWLKNIIKLS